MIHFSNIFLLFLWTLVTLISLSNFVSFPHLRCDTSPLICDAGFASNGRWIWRFQLFPIAIMFIHVFHQYRFKSRFSKYKIFPTIQSYWRRVEQIQWWRESHSMSSERYLLEINRSSSPVVNGYLGSLLSPGTLVAAWLSGPAGRRPPPTPSEPSSPWWPCHQIL